MAAGRPRVRRAARQRVQPSVWAKIKRERWMYAFVLPGLPVLRGLSLLPLLGNIVAFENYSPYLGFFDSPWVGFDNFGTLFTDPGRRDRAAQYAHHQRTAILFYFPATIGLALLLNSIAARG